MKEIAEKIKQAGGKMYLVGGCVRDQLLNIPPKDEDYCVTGLSAREFLTLFPEAKLRGNDFPVFVLENHEVALARKERKTGEGHRAFVIETDNRMTIEEDLARRDVTINSMAYDILEEKLIDPFHGKEDCEKKILRATSDAFSEDPLRVYRVARFAAQLGFTIAEETKRKMELLKNELSSLSKERVYEELKKALEAQKPSLFFEALKETSCLEPHFTELARLIGVEQPIQYHPEGDAFVHTMEVLDRASQKTDDVVIRFSALVHDLGKGRTSPEILPHHYGHEQLGVECVREMCNRLKLPNAWRKAGITSCLEHMRAGKFFEMKTATQVDFLERVAKSYLGLKGLEMIANSDKVREKEIEFATLGEEMLQKINAKTLHLENENYEILKEKVRQERIKWLSARMHEVS